MKKALLLLLLVVSSGALAQERRRVVPDGSAAADRPITAEERKQIGVILPYLLDTMYVLPEKSKELAQQVRGAFASGRYDSITTANALADALNRDLAAANDRHLNVRFSERDPSQPVLTVEAWEARHAAMRAEAAPASGFSRPSREYDRDQVRRNNFGVLAAEVLPGNVGYLKMQGFLATDETRAAIASAMALLAHTDAMIVDVRECPGGNPDTVAYLASYFFGPEKKVLMNRYNRPANQTWESTTLDVPGKRRPDTDLYVLTGRTGSACESFAFTLQQWGRAKTVGEITSGAGYNNMLINVGLGLVFSVSTGTATHPKTGKGWEAIGVKPDIAVSADRARETAHAEALQVLSEKATSEPQKRALQSALQRVSLSMSPVPAMKLEDYVGTYGIRKISVRDGALWFERTGGSSGALKALARDQFDLNGAVILAFERGENGAVKAMRIQFPDGKSETVARE
jgi:retinol-binding protein 3